MPRQATVLVADPFPIFRAGIGRAVRQHPDLRLVAEAECGQAVLAEVEAKAPDVAVLGVPLGDVAADRIANAIARDGFPTRTVLVLTQPDAEAAFSALAHGASACVTRTIEPAALVRCVRAVLRGETVLAPELQGGLVREIRRRTLHGRVTLSVRERQVLAQVAEGLGTTDIARRLHIRESTVKTHVANAAEKLGASTRAAAVAIAIRTGVLD
jgi:two-component system, NarL family, nitrate/nitrite response regulator NarL